MALERFLKFARTYEIRPVIDINQNLEEGLQELFDQVHSCAPWIHYVPPEDRRIFNIRFNNVFLGESLEYALNDISNECNLDTVIIEREDGGINVTIEKNKRLLSFKEVIDYRRTHPE